MVSRQLGNRSHFVCAGTIGRQLRPRKSGSRAPAFDLVGSPKPVRLADLKGQVVYVDFWASWCAPCKQSFPWMNEMQAKYGARGFTVVGINVDQKREDADKFLASTRQPSLRRVRHDGQSRRGLSAEGYADIVSDRRRRQGARGHVGFKDSQREELEREIQSALSAAQ